jgi:N-acetyl-gamma-glutamylphosphate reductase
LRFYVYTVVEVQNGVLSVMTAYTSVIANVSEEQAASIFRMKYRDNRFVEIICTILKMKAA